MLRNSPGLIAGAARQVWWGACLAAREARRASPSHATWYLSRPKPRPAMGRHRKPLRWSSEKPLLDLPRGVPSLRRSDSDLPVRSACSNHKYFDRTS